MKSPKIMMLIAVIAIVPILCCGCAAYKASPGFPRIQATQIVLKENDFKVRKCHLTGTAACSYILGTPLEDPKVHTRAMADIQHAAAATGKAAQLINWTCDFVTTDFWFWRQEKVVYSADLIEFVK